MTYSHRAFRQISPGRAGILALVDAAVYTPNPEIPDSRQNLCKRSQKTAPSGMVGNDSISSDRVKSPVWRKAGQPATNWPFSRSRSNKGRTPGARFDSRYSNV